MNAGSSRPRKAEKEVENSPQGHKDISNCHRAFANNDGDMKNCTYTELANWLTSVGYATSVDDVKNAKRSGSGETNWTEVKDTKVRDLLDVIRHRYSWPKV